MVLRAVCKLRISGNVKSVRKVNYKGAFVSVLIYQSYKVESLFIVMGTGTVNFVLSPISHIGEIILI